MPPRKKTTEEIPSDQESASEVENNDEPTIPAESTEMHSPPKKDLGQDNENEQLFFSTDGTETGKMEENPYLDEEIDKEPSFNVVKTSVPATDNPITGERKESENSSNSPINKPNRGPSPHPQKKQNWQDKKKQRNKQRQKFKKPKRLPYEETETKPLELGDLLENESLQSLEGIATLAEDFNGSDQDPVELDHLLALSLQDLKEKVVPYELNLGQAPLREEIIDALLAKYLEDKTPVLISGIVQVMEDGHAFLLQQKEDYRL